MNLKTHFLPLKYSLVPYWLFWNRVEQAIWISSKSCFFCCFFNGHCFRGFTKDNTSEIQMSRGSKSENRQLNHVKLEYDKHKEEPTDHLTWNHSTRSPVTSVQSSKLKVKRRPAHRLQPLTQAIHRSSTIINSIFLLCIELWSLLLLCFSFGFDTSCLKFTKNHCKVNFHYNPFCGRESRIYHIE